MRRGSDEKTDLDLFDLNCNKRREIFTRTWQKQLDYHPNPPWNSGKEAADGAQSHTLEF